MSDIIGTNSNILINGVGYLVKEGSYSRDKKRYFSHQVTQVGNMFFTDFGPLFDEVKCTLLLYPLMIFRGTLYTYDPQTQMLALETLYQNKNTTFVINAPTAETFSTSRFIDQKVNIPTSATFITDGNGTHPDCYEIDAEFLNAISVT